MDRKYSRQRKLGVVDPLPGGDHLTLDADQQAADVVALSEEKRLTELGGVGDRCAVDVVLVLVSIQMQDVGLPLLGVFLTDDDAKLGFFQVQGHRFLRVVG